MGGSFWFLFILCLNWNMVSRVGGLKGRVSRWITLIRVWKPIPVPRIFIPLSHLIYTIPYLFFCPFIEVLTICEPITKGRRCGGSLDPLVCIWCGQSKCDWIFFFVLSFEFGPPTLMWVSIPFHFLVCCFILLFCFGFQFNSCVSYCIFLICYLLICFVYWNPQKIAKEKIQNK